MLPIKSPQMLGVALRETRTALGIPADVLASMAGVSAVTLRKFETGEATAAIKTLFALFRELGIEFQVDVPPNVKIELPPSPEVPPRRSRAKR